MRHYFTFLLIIVATNSFAQTEVLRNESIVKMISAGISNDVIIKKIKTNTIDSFNISTDELIKLKSKKVPDTILMVIIEKANENNQSNTNFTSEIKAKNVNYKINEAPISINKLTYGICYYNKENNEYKHLPEVRYIDSYPKEKTNNNLLGLGLDFIPEKQSFIIDGSKSTFQINDNSPTFYFKNLTMISGGDMDKFKIYYASTIKNKRKIIPEKKETCIKPIVKLIKDDIIMITLEKKLPIGSYIFASSGGFYEFDIMK